MQTRCKLISRKEPTNSKTGIRGREGRGGCQASGLRPRGAGIQPIKCACITPAPVSPKTAADKRNGLWNLDLGW